MLKQTTLLAACASFAALLGGCATTACSCHCRQFRYAGRAVFGSLQQPLWSNAVQPGSCRRCALCAACAKRAGLYAFLLMFRRLHLPFPEYIRSVPYAPVDINAATHTIVRGDTVYNISKRYHISQDDFCAWSGMTDNTLSIGQVVKSQSYRICRTESRSCKKQACCRVLPRNRLYSPHLSTSTRRRILLCAATRCITISKRYHISQDDFRAWNGVTDNMLSIGQIVKVNLSGDMPHRKPQP